MPEDDLFQDSTMTFGEHLEELRGALFRSCAGLVLGMLVALFVADDVVTWIERPLRKGLRGFYLKKAKGELAAGVGEKASIEDWAVLERLNWVPRVIRVSPTELARALGTAPSRDGRWRLSDLPKEVAATIRQDLLRGGKTPNQPAGIAWSLLTVESQTALQNEAINDVAAVIEALNALIEHQQFSELAFDEAIERCSDPDQKRIIERTYESLQQESRTDTRRALNRQLLQLMFPEIGGYEPDLVELVTWSPMDVQVQALSVHEPFMIYLKAAFVLGFIFSSPWIFFQVWQFVAAGLYPYEKQLVYVFLPFSVGLFLLGASLAFFFVFDPVLDFLFSFNLKINVDAEPRITDWISFVLLLPLGFGISFQLPLVMLFLERIGMFTVESYLSQWRIAVLAIFVLSMFLTPADPISMVLMAMPLTILFFGGVLLCKYFPRDWARRTRS